jgi:hypothetical protein
MPTARTIKVVNLWMLKKAQDTVIGKTRIAHLDIVREAKTANVPATVVSANML